MLSSEGFGTDILVTTGNWLLGLATAVAIGVPVGLLLGSVPKLNEVSRLVVEFLRPIPSVALIPLAVLVFGTGTEMRVFVMTFAAVWPILFNTIYGLMEVDPLAKETARSYGCGRLAVALRVSLPSAAPFVVTGIRLAAAIALILEVTAELFGGGGHGIGTVIGLAIFGSGQKDVVLAGVLVAVVLMAPVVLAAPGDFWDQTIGFALDEQGLQRLPLPGAWDGGFEPNRLLHHYFPYVLLGGSALWLAAALRERAPLRLWAPAPLAAAGAAYLLARADDYHLVPLAAVLPVLLATAAARERSAGRTAWALALAAVLALVALNGLDRKRIQLLDPPAQAALDVDVADGVKAPEAEARALAQLVRFVRTRVPEGEPVFVANPRHDLVKVGNPLVYVLAGRPNPTRYDVMQPGVVTTAPVQREIVGDLRAARPELVIRWLSPVADQPEPNGAGEPSGVRVLDDYLARAYVPDRRFGDYQVLRRRG
jgi:NitT/TauT family transport system permease protein